MNREVRERLEVLEKAIALVQVELDNVKKQLGGNKRKTLKKKNVKRQ